MAPQLSIDDQKQQEVASKREMEKGRLVRAKQDPPQRSVTIVILPQQCTTMSAISQKPNAENISRTLNNSCEHDPSMLPTSKQPSASRQVEELNADLASDPFAAYFNFMDDPHTPPKVLIITSPKASKATYDFCDEIVGMFPGTEYVWRKTGKGFEVGRIAGRAAGRGYKHLLRMRT